MRGLHLRTPGGLPEAEHAAPGTNSRPETDGAALYRCGGRSAPSGRLAGVTAALWGSIDSPGGAGARAEDRLAGSATGWIYVRVRQGDELEEALPVVGKVSS